MPTEVTYTAYTFAELEELFPESAARLVKREVRRRENEGYVPWTDEIWNSCKEFLTVLGTHPNEWECKSCGYAHFSDSAFPDWSHLWDARRKMAYLEARLSPLRIPYEPLSKNGKRRELAAYGRFYRAGMLKPCPFTGYCADEELLEVAYEYAKQDRYSWREVLSRIVRKTYEIAERESEHYVSEEAASEYLREYAGETYTAGGAELP